MAAGCAERAPPRRPRFRAALAAALLVALALLAEPSAARAPEAPAVVGVNRTNLAWWPPEARAAVPRAIAATGIAAVRLDWRAPPAEPMADVLNQVRDAGLAALIVFNFPPVVLEPGSEPPPWDNRSRLSALSPPRFAAWFKSALDAIEASGVRLLALQIGNEINWSGFNGDLPMASPGAAWASLDEMPAPVRARYEEGLRRYLAALREARAARDARPALAGVPIVTTGLSEVDPFWAPRGTGTGVQAPVALRHLAELGAFEVADGVGNHAYSAFGPVGDLRASLRAAWAACGGPLVRGRPCWVTEWGGVRPPANDCDTREPGRVAQVEAAADVVRELGPGRIAGTFFYDWDEGGRERALVRCGEVSDAARRLGEWARTGR